MVNRFSKLLFFLVVSFIFSTNTAHAATKYWIGSSGGSFASNSNWSTSSGGANNTTAPGTSDIATFSSGGTNNAAIDSTIDVGGISIISGYTGTITQSSGVNVTVESSNFSIAAGTYTGSNGLITINGTFTQSGGTITLSSATTTFKGAFSKTSGTFNHNSGIAFFDTAVNNSFNVTSGGATFYTVWFTKTAAATADTIVLLDNFSIANNLFMVNQSFFSNENYTTLTVRSSAGASPTISVTGNVYMPTYTGGIFYLGNSSVSSNLTLDIKGNLTINDTQIYDYATTTFSGTGDQTITKTDGVIFGNATWSSTKVSGNLNIISYAYTATDVLPWASGSITANPGVALSGLTLTGGTFTASTTAAFQGAFTQSGGTFNASTATTTFKNTFTITGGTFNTNSGIVVFDTGSNSNFNVKTGGTSFNNVWFTKTAGNSGDTISLQDNMSVSGNLFFENAYFLNNENYTSLAVRGSVGANPTITVTGNTYWPNFTGGTFTLGNSTASSNLTLNVKGNFYMDDAQAASFATTTFSGTGDQIISKTNATIYSTSAPWSSTKASGNLNIVAYSYVSGDTLPWSSGNITANGGLTLSALNLTGGTFTAASSTVTFQGAFSQTGGTFVPSTATTTFKNTFTRTGGTFNASSGAVVFDTVFNNNFNVTTGGASFYNLWFTKTGSVTGDAITLLDNVTVSNDLTLINQYFYNSESYTSLTVRSSSSIFPTISVAGNVNIPQVSGGSFVLGYSTGSANLSLDVKGNYTIGDNEATSYATTTLSGTGTQTITKSAGTWSTNGWIINKNSGSALLANNVTFPGLLTIASGTLNINGKNTTVTGAFTVQSGGILELQGAETITSPTLNTGSTVVYDGSGSYSSLLLGNTYHHLTFNGSGNWTLASALTVNGDLTITSGSLLASGKAIGVAGTWSNSGTFTHGSNTVTLSGTDQTITGGANTTFYNLIKSVSATSTLTFNNARTTTVSNNTTLKGISGHLLKLRSSSSGSQFGINISNSGTRDIQYVDVQDSNNTNATAVTCLTGCTNSGNNTNWTFTPLPPGNFAGSAATTSITWTWVDTGSDETGFKLYNSSTNALVTTLATANLTSYTEYGLTRGSTYGRYLTAYNASSESASSTVGSVSLSVATQTISISAATSVTATTATLNASITDTGGADATQSGFAYGTSANLTSVIATSTLGSQTGAVSFSGGISSLTCNTTYYVRAYTTNSAGTSYSSITSFATSACVQTVTVGAATSITAATALLNGSITATGGANATQSGFAYGTSTDLTSVIATTTLGSQVGTGSFSGSISSLSCNTTYYFRAYTTNSAGTAYSSITSFTTSACVPTVTTSTPSSVTTVLATLNASVADTGGADSTEHGFSYSTVNDLSSIIATTALGSQTGTGAFSSHITSLTCNTKYYYRAYAVNTAGTGYSAIDSFTTASCPVVITEPEHRYGGSSSVSAAAMSTFAAPTPAPRFIPFVGPKIKDIKIKTKPEPKSNPKPVTKPTPKPAIIKQTPKPAPIIKVAPPPIKVVPPKTKDTENTSAAVTPVHTSLWDWIRSKLSFF